MGVEPGLVQWLSTLLLPLGSRGAPPQIRRIELRYAYYVPLAVMLGLLTSALEGLGIGMLVPLLTLMLNPEGAGAYPQILRDIIDLAIATAPGRPLVALSGAVMGLVLVKVAVQVANAHLMAKVQANAGRDIRDALAEKVLHLQYEFFLRNEVGRLVTIIDTDSWKATDAVRTIFGIAVAAATVAMFSLLLLIANWQLFALVCVGVGLSRLAQASLSGRLKQLGRFVVSTNHQLGEQMIQIVRAIRVIRCFGQERRELDTFVEASERVRRSMLAADRATGWSMPLIEIILSGVVMSVLLAADWMRIGLPGIVAFLVLLYRAQSPLLVISHASLTLAGLRGSIEQVEWLLAAGPPRGINMLKTDDGGRLDFNQPLRFENVSYAYGEAPGGASAINGIGFEVLPHATVALVGASGAGKSTVINLLCRLIEPDAGRILLGDVDLATIEPAEWRRHLAIAGQDLELVSGSVAANIAYGRAGASRAEVEEAARLADADGFIARLPQGYDTMIGALGFGLSGGQRQRIGLARALLMKPEILILDEATSAVDGISEHAIMRLLQEHRGFGRAIVVSHRISSLRLCETALELAGGRLMSQGAFQDTAWFKDAEAQTAADWRA